MWQVSDHNRWLVANAGVGKDNGKPPGFGSFPLLSRQHTEIPKIQFRLFTGFTHLHSERLSRARKVLVDVDTEIDIGSLDTVFFPELLVYPKLGDFLIKPFFNPVFVGIELGGFLPGLFLNQMVSLENIADSISVAAELLCDISRFNALLVKGLNSDLFVHSEHKDIGFVCSPPFGVTTNIYFCTKLFLSIHILILYLTQLFPLIGQEHTDIHFPRSPVVMRTVVSTLSAGSMQRGPRTHWNTGYLSLLAGEADKCSGDRFR
jgi:hypothetical protein